MLEQKAQVVERDGIISGMQEKIDDLSHKMQDAIQRNGEMRRLIVGYNDSIFFWMYKAWLWLVARYKHNKLRDILYRYWREHGINR